MLKIGTDDYDALRRHGEEAYPEESCGIMVGIFAGETRMVSSIVRCRNASQQLLQTRYHIDPHDLVRAQREARAQGLEVVGFYHSHPDHPAIWSRTDLEEAHWIGCSYVITAVEGGSATQTNSFVLTGTLEEDKELKEEELLITAF